MSQEKLVDWMIGLEASGATKVLNEFVDKARSGMKGLNDQAAAIDFAKTIRPMVEGNAPLGKALREYATAKSSAVAFALGLEDVNKKVGRYIDLRHSVEQTNHVFKKGLIDAAAAQRALNLAMEEGENRERARQNSVGSLKSIGMAIAAAGGFKVHQMASSGFAGTLQGQQADVYGQLLNRQVAAIFAPLLEEKTKYVSQMTQWLAGLKEPQRESIRTMASFAAGMTILGFVVPKVTTALLTMTRDVALKGHLGGMMQASAQAGGRLASMTAMAHPIGLAIAAALSVAGATPQGRELLADTLKALQPVIELLGESIQALRPTIDLLSSVIKFFNSKKKDDEFMFPKWIRDAAGKSADDISYIYTGRWLTDAIGITNVSKQSSNMQMVPKGFESIENAFNRINEAATQADLEQKIADNTAATAENTNQIADGVRTMIDIWRMSGMLGPVPQAMALIGY